MLEIDGDFAKKVAVPALSHLDEVEKVLIESDRVADEDVGVVVDKLRRHCGSNRLSIAVKNVLDCIYEARADEDRANFPDTLADLLIERILLFDDRDRSY